MSILTVKNMSHVFGGRVIYEDVSFKLNKGEHVGFIGANGEGKSTFMKIITNKLMPDDGIIEWAKRVRVGYMDQHAELKKGVSVRDTLKTAFEYLFKIEEEYQDFEEAAFLIIFYFFALLKAHLHPYPNRFL